MCWEFIQKILALRKPEVKVSSDPVARELAFSHNGRVIGHRGTRSHVPYAFFD